MATFLHIRAGHLHLKPALSHSTPKSLEFCRG